MCFSDSGGAPGPGLVLRCDGQAGAAGDGGRHPQTHEQQGDGARPADAVHHIRGNDEKNRDLNKFTFEEHVLPPDVFLSESLGESALLAGPECYSCPAVVQPLKTFTVINKKSWRHLGFLCILHNIPTSSADTARFRMCVHSDAASVCNEQQSQDLWR